MNMPLATDILSPELKFTTLPQAKQKEQMDPASHL